MARLPNFLVIIRSEKLSGKGQGRGAKKRTFRFGKKNVSFPKVETFRFADYTKLGLRELFNEINLLKGKIKNVADFVKANYESLHQSDSPVFAILNAIYI